MSSFCCPISHFPCRPAVFPNLKGSGGPRHGLERRWWSWGVEREMSRRGAELFHGTDFAVPYLPRRPSVLTLHDLSPWMNPEWHNGADRVRKRTPVLIGLHLATMVLTFSDAVRAQAIEKFRIHPSRVVTVPLAASELFRPVPVERSGKPYFLFVGTLEPRKNIPVLVEAWREVRKKSCGGSGPGGPAARRFPRPAARRRVEVIGRGAGRAIARPLLGRRGRGVSVMLRGIRPAGARGHAVRSVRDHVD